MNDFVFDKIQKKIIKYLGNDLEVKIPQYIDGIKVTIIGDFSFDQKNLKKIEIPDSIEIIEMYAFRFNKLTNIKLPNSLREIHYNAFEYNLLNEISIPNKVREIGGYSFSRNQLKKVNLSENLKKIGAAAFAFNKIEEINLPPSINEIDRDAFENNSIKKIIIPGTVEKIGPSAFISNKISEVLIYNKNTQIGNRAFSQNPIEKFKIEGIENINDIENVYIYREESKAIVGYNEYYGRKISIPNVIDEKEVLIIEDRAFENSYLKEVSIPDKIVSIGRQAFYNNELNKVTIGQHVKKIGNNAFKKQNNQLNEILILGDKFRFNERWEKIGFPKRLMPKRAFESSEERVNPTSYVKTDCSNDDIQHLENLDQYDQYKGDLNMSSLIDELYRLKSLLEEGLINQDEFDNLKKRIIAKENGKVNLDRFDKLKLYENVDIENIKYDYFVKVSNDRFIAYKDGLLKSNLEKEFQENIQIDKLIRYNGMIIHSHEYLELNEEQYDFFSKELHLEEDVTYLGQNLDSYIEDIIESADDDIVEEFKLGLLEKQTLKTFYHLEAIEPYDYDLPSNALIVTSRNSSKNNELEAAFDLILNKVLSLLETEELEKGFKFSTAEEELDKIDSNLNKYYLVNTNNENYSSVVHFVINIGRVNDFNLLKHISENKFLEVREDVFHQENWWEVEPYLFLAELKIYQGDLLVLEVDYIAD